MAPGARSNFGDPCSKLMSFGSKCIVLKKLLVTLLGIFSAPAVIRRPGNCALLPLPRYAPDCGMSETMRPDPPCSCRFSELRWQEMLLLSPSSVASFLCFTWTDNSHHTVKTSFQDLSLAEPAHQRDSVSLHAAAVNVTPPETSWTDGDLNLWL